MAFPSGGALLADITTQLKEHFEFPFIEAMNRDVFMLRRVSREKGVGKSVQWKIHSTPGNTSAGSYAENAVVPAAGKQTYTEAEVNITRNWVTVFVSNFANAASQGAGGYFELLSNEMKEALEDLKNELNSQMIATSQTGNDLDSLGYIVDDGQVDAARTGYAGITFSSNTWWKPYVSAAASARPLTIALMQDQLENLSEPDRKANTNAILTSRKHFYDYGNLLQDQRRYVNTMTLDGGFTAIDFESIPVIVVPALTNGDMYFMDEKGWGYYVLQDFEVTEKDVDGDGQKYITTHYSQLVCKELHKQGRIADLA